MTRAFRKAQHHSKPVMSQRANTLAYRMWLSGCSNVALAAAAPTSIANCYGLRSADVASDIAAEIGRRAIQGGLA